MPVQFFFNETHNNLRNRTALKAFIGQIFTRKKKKLISLHYIFCTDQFLLDINRRFLKHDFYTDIISFDLSDKMGSIEGEIYISTERLRENAKLNNVPLQHELHRLLFHGALHLCGYKDKSSKDKLEMTKEEDRLLEQYFSKCSTWKTVV